MPGIIEPIAYALRLNDAQPVEAAPAFDPQVIQNLHEGNIPVEQHQARINAALDNFAQQAQPGEGNPTRQVEFFHYAGEAPQPLNPPWQGNGIGVAQNAYGVQPWEFRQQVFPQAIETRLSADDVEKIAQRVLILIEEREAE